MMQSRRWEHASSGELDVFGATSYFAGLLPARPDDDDDCASSVTEPSSASRLYLQANKVVQRDTAKMTTMEGNSFRGPHQKLQQLAAGVHGHAAERHVTSKQQLQLQVVTAKRQQPAAASGKSKLAALLSFMVSPSPSPRASSFRKEEKKKKKQQQQQAAPSTPTTRLLLLRQAEAASAASGEKKTSSANKPNHSPSSLSSSRESCSMRLQGLLGPHDDDDDGDDELDLGVATGDRRLQGITVVRGGGGGGGEERWVVRCVPGPGPGACWDDDVEHHREKMLGAAESAASSEQNIKDDELVVKVEQQGDGDDGNVDPAHSWDSDSSSDLFDLDLEYR